jgi:hypothetical protein
VNPGSRPHPGPAPAPPPAPAADDPPPPAPAARAPRARRDAWPRRLTAAALLALALGWVIAGQRRQGVVRDEVVYRDAGSRYADWWIDLVTLERSTLSEEAITAHFGGRAATANNREHPPLMKTLFGLSERLFHRALGWTTATTAYRLPTALANALLVVLVFCFAQGLWGYRQGLVAALLVLLLPRGLFHAGLATFDAPIVTLWFATLLAYHRALPRPGAPRGRIGGAIGLGVCFGLALATKHNAVLLPFALLAHYAWVAWRSQAGAAGGAGRLRRFARGLWRTQPLVAPALLLLGPLVLVALWPWLWFDTLDHAGDWMRFHLDHVHYNFEYLGRNWNHPPFPWHVALITTLFTVPVVTLVGAALGAALLAARARAGAAADPARAPALLLFLSAGASMGPFLLGTTPIFGAEKHWAPAIPTLAVFAGVGVVWAADLAAGWLAGRLPRVRAARITAAASAVVIAAVASAAAVETVDAQPYALTHYNALAGGAPGGADLGMNRQFWGYAARGVLPHLDRRAAGAGSLPVYSHDASMSWGVYRREGWLAPNLPDAGHEQRGIDASRLALVIHELHFNRHDYLIWKAYGTVQPVYVLTTDGVPIVSVYARPTPSTSGTRRR